MEAQSNEIYERLRQSPIEVNLTALRTYCQRTGEVALWAHGLALYARAQEDAAVAANGLFEAGQTHFEQLGDAEAACPLLLEALERWPTHPGALDQLRGVLLHLEEYAAWAQVLEEYIHALTAVDGDPLEISALHLELGHLWRDQLERLDRAVAHYRSSVDFDAAQREAIRSAREIYFNVGKWESVAKLLGVEAESYPQGPKKAALLVELAQVQQQRFGSLDAAATSLEEALSNLPGDLGVQHQLATLLLERADRAHPSAQANQDRERAAMLLTQMAGAVDDDYALAYTEAALDAAPGHDGALLLYERVATRAARASDIPARWVGYLQAAPSGEDARRVRLELARAYLDAGQQDDAATCLEPLLRSGDPEARALMADPAEADDAGTQVSSANRHRAPETISDKRDAAAARAVDATTRHDALSPADLASSLSPSIERALTDLDLEELSGEITPVSTMPTSELHRFREDMRAASEAENTAAAAELADHVLELSPDDPQALRALEVHARTLDDPKRLRDVLRQLARLSDRGLDERLEQLREAAQLCEGPLGDTDGAVDALNAILALAPGDPATVSQLKSLLARSERWDALVSLLEQQAAEATSVQAQASVYRELVTLHRDQRKRIDDAIEALRYLRDLEPEAREHEDTLSALLLEAGQYTEAAALLEARLLETEEAPARLALLRTLAGLYEISLEAPEKAHEISTAALRIAPSDMDFLERCVRIDESQQRYDRLAASLIRQAEHLAGKERAQLHVRAAELAADTLQDMDLACTQYDAAIAVTPRDEAVWASASRTFEAHGRHVALGAVIEREAVASEDPAFRATLRRRLAVLRAGHNDLAGAARALEDVLAEETTDQDSRRSLVDLLEQLGDRPDATLAQLEILATSTDDAAEARALRMRRVELLRDTLQDPAAARDEVRRVLADHADDLDALRALSSLLETLGDGTQRAATLERLLDLEEAPERRRVAEQLADWADEQSDQALARRALAVWCELDPQAREPRERLLPWLQGATFAAQRLSTLDALAQLTSDEEESLDFTLQAARIAADELGDVDGAWRRLVPAAQRERPAAEEALRTLARDNHRGTELAELYVALAQRFDDTLAQTRRWVDAAQAYEELAANVPQAFEAILRALALNLDSGALLDEADRLAGLSGAWERLSQVYDSLARRADSADTALRVLLRHATLLEEQAQDSGAALERVLKSCALSPADDAMLAWAARLARQTGRDTELLPAYERRAQLAESSVTRTRELLAACSLAYRKLEDPAKAKAYLGHAVSATELSAYLLDEIERQVRELDASAPVEASQGLEHVLAEIYTARAEDPVTDAATATRLLRRAAHLHLHEDGRGDEAAALQALVSAYERSPGNAELLEELAALAECNGSVESLLPVLRRTADDALDSVTASLALRTLSRFLEEVLGRPADAVDVYKQLTSLAPDDVEAHGHLRACLRDADRHEELLIAINARLSKATDERERCELLREAARCWQHGLKNPFEALEAWRKVAALLPNDEEAALAARSIKVPSSAADEDDGLTPSGLTVVPEDLIASEQDPETQDESLAEAADLGAGIEAADQAADEFEDRETTPPPAMDSVPEAAEVGPALAPLADLLEEEPPADTLPLTEEQEAVDAEEPEAVDAEEVETDLLDALEDVSESADESGVHTSVAAPPRQTAPPPLPSTPPALPTPPSAEGPSVPPPPPTSMPARPPGLATPPAVVDDPTLALAQLDRAQAEAEQDALDTDEVSLDSLDSDALILEDSVVQAPPSAPEYADPAEGGSSLSDMEATIHRAKPRSPSQAPPPPRTKPPTRSGRVPPPPPPAATRSAVPGGSAPPRPTSVPPPPPKPR